MATEMKTNDKKSMTSPIAKAQYRLACFRSCQQHHLSLHDVYFDENFESTIAFENSRYPGYIDCVITDAKAHEDLHVERTGSALWFSNKQLLSNGTVVQAFAQPHVAEAYDFDLTPTSLPQPDDSSLDDSTNNLNEFLGEEEEGYPRHIDQHICSSVHTSTSSSNDTVTPPDELHPPPTSFPLDDDNARSTVAVAPTTPPRYFTRRQAQLKFQLDPPPDEYTQYVQLAYQAEVDQQIQPWTL
jgi:hypothetical protein